MFDQFGTDYTKLAVQLNQLLPSVNQSEASHSILSTLFQRWVTKPNLTNVAGSIGFSKTTIAGAIEEAVAIRQAYQLYPVFYHQQGEQSIVYDWNDILRKLAFTGVDPTEYPSWGTTTTYDFKPPIDLDKFINYSEYFWIDTTTTTTQPDYVTIVANRVANNSATPITTNDWSSSNKWVHKSNIGNRIAFAKKAQLPIIEFEDIQLSRWYAVHRTWKKLNLATGVYVPTTDQPSWDTPTLATDWELQSELLVPIADQQLVIGQPTEVVATTYDSNADKTTITLNSDYLRGQLNVRLFDKRVGALAPLEYGQLVEFEEQEAPSGQYSRIIIVPGRFTAGELEVHIGPHHQSDNMIVPKLVRLAPGFTSFTPSTGTLFQSIPTRSQFWDLSKYRLLGQRKLTTHQLPTFNLFSLLPNPSIASPFNQEVAIGNILRYAEDVTQSVQFLTGQRISSTSGDLNFITDLVTSDNKLLSYRLNGTNTNFTIWKIPTTALATHTPQYVDATRTPVSTSLPGGWEPSQLLTANPLRETRPNFRYSEVTKHFQSILQGESGTIKISDDGGSHLISSAIANDLSIPTLIQFIADEMDTFRKQMETQIVSQLLRNSGLQTTPLAAIPTVIYNTLKESATLEGGSDSAYDDTLSYDPTTTLGYPAFPLTFGILGVTPVQVPLVEVDRTLNHSAIRVHDGSYYYISLSAREIFSLENALATAVVTGPTAPNPSSNFCIWRSTPTDTYRFESNYFTSNSTTRGDSPPNPALNSTWYDAFEKSAFIWNGTNWIGHPTNALWIRFDVVACVLEVLLIQEQQIIALINYRSLAVIDVLPPISDRVVGSVYDNKQKTDYDAFSYAYQLRDPANQLTSKLLTPITSTNPFSWNYSYANPAWPSSVYALYSMLYNTPIPNKQPWMIQGFVDKPSWWDTEYRDTTATRSWIPQMWTNIRNGIVPVGSLPVGSVIPSIIPVNTTTTTVSGYNPDDLLPPYVYRENPAEPHPLDGSILVTSATQLGTYLIFPTTYRSGSYFENIWKTNANTIARSLIASYQLDPIKVVTKLVCNPTRTNTFSLGGLQINTLTNNVIKSTDPLHGEDGVLDQTLLSALTFISRRRNFSNNDNSPLYAWKTWSTRLGYQTNSLIVPQTLRVYDTCNNIANYSVVLKKSENIRQILFSNIIIQLSRAGDSTTLPTGYGFDWEFKLSCSESIPTVRRRYDILQQNVVWDTANSVFSPTSGQIKWITGEEVKFITPPAGVTVNKFFTNVAGGHLTLHDTAMDAVAGTNALDFSVLQSELTWDDTLSAFTLPTGSVGWASGQNIRLITTIPGIPIHDLFVDVSNSHITLHSTASDAAKGINALTFDFSSSANQVTVQIVPTLRTVKSTFTAGGLDWETVEVDRTSVVTFNFADTILITGVQSVIDFIVSYTEYMQDDGIVINAGETPELDPDTNAVVSWQQQISKAINKIYASTGLSIRDYSTPLIQNAAGRYSPAVSDRTLLTNPFVELNPFRRTVYFHTPDGVICDINHTPYANDSRSVAALYDDTGSPIHAAELIPLRTDRLTSVIFNDAQPARTFNPDQDVSRRVAYGAVALDFYEHVLVFDQQTSNGLTIFDRYFNLQKKRLNLEFQRSIDFNYRPVMGGFSVTQTETLPNFEMIAEYQRSSYDVAESNELVQSTADVRYMLGKLPLPYFQAIPVTSKTEFQFWQQMIREKGTKGALTTYTRHKLYENVDYDEFWAWKLGTFGAAAPRRQVELRLMSDDVLNLANSFWFSPDPVSVSTNFPISAVGPLDQTRWIDFPNYLDIVNPNGIAVNNQPTGSISFILFPPPYPQPSIDQFIAHGLTGDVLTGVSEEFDVNTATILRSTVTVSQSSTAVQFPIDPNFAFDPSASKQFILLNNSIAPATIVGFTATLQTPVSARSDLTLLTIRGAARLVKRFSISPTNHAIINESVITDQFSEFGRLTVVTITGNLPEYSSVSPLRMIDSTSKIVTKTLPAWDPANHIHSASIAQFDFVQSNDPARYNRTLLDEAGPTWGVPQLGQYWLDSDTLRYKPYFDPTIFSFDDQTRLWGELADQVSPVAYQWVESSTIPTAASTDYPHTRQVRKNRISSTNLTWNAGQSTFSSTSPFVTGNYVVLYKRDSAITTPIDNLVGVEYVVNGTQNSFTLNSVAGVPLVIPSAVTPTTLGTSLFIASSSWDSAPSTLIGDLTATFYACNSNTFTIDSTWLELCDVTSNAVVHLNGATVGYDIQLNSTSTAATLIIVSDTGEPRTLRNSDIITLTYPASALNTGGIPPQTSNQLFYVSTEVPYAEHVKTVNQRRITTYYYWAASPTTVSNSVKTQTLEYALKEVIKPTSGDYFAVRHSTSPSRQLITLWGLLNTHQVTNKALAIDFDKNLRDRYINAAVSKTVNEQWVIFREFQDIPPHPAIWEATTATVTGLRNIDSVATIVPAPIRVTYDYLYDTTLQYGTGMFQTLISPIRARELFVEYFSAANVELDPANRALLATTEWTSLVLTGQYQQACDYAFINFPAPLLNTFVFNIIREGLYNGYQYDGMFKTSYVFFQTAQKVTVGK